MTLINLGQTSVDPEEIVAVTPDWIENPLGDDHIATKLILKNGVMITVDGSVDVVRKHLQEYADGKSRANNLAKDPPIPWWWRSK